VVIRTILDYTIVWMIYVNKSGIIEDEYLEKIKEIKLNKWSTVYNYNYTPLGKWN